MPVIDIGLQLVRRARDPLAQGFQTGLRLLSVAIYQHRDQFGLRRKMMVDARLPDADRSGDVGIAEAVVTSRHNEGLRDVENFFCRRTY